MADFHSPDKGKFEKQISDDPVDAAGRPLGKRTLWSKTRYILTAILPAVALILLLDLALAQRHLLSADLEHRWWGREHTGCWVAELGCQTSTVGGEVVDVWQEGDDGTTEEECIEAANRLWRVCADPNSGFAAASYRPTGRTVVIPETAASDPRLQATMSVRLGGSGALFNPVGDPWVVELCDGGVCQKFPVDSLCGEDISSSAMQILLSAPVALCGGCLPTKDGPWPTCLASDDFAACMTDHCNAERGPNDSCTSLCTAAHQARSFYNFALVGTIVTTFLIWASFWYGWCKHSGTVAAFFAMLAAVAVPVALIILAGADVASVIQTSSSLKRTTDWTPTSAIVEAVFITLILATESFLVIGVAKSLRATKYSPLNGGVECCPWFFRGRQDEELGHASEDEESPNPKAEYYANSVAVAPKPGRSSSAADELEKALDQVTAEKQDEPRDNGAGLGLGNTEQADVGGSWASPPEAKDEAASGSGKHLYKDSPAAVQPEPEAPQEETQKPPEEPPRKMSPEPATIGAPTYLQATAPAPRQVSKNSVMSRLRGQTKSKEPAAVVVEPAAPEPSASGAARELEVQLDALEGKTDEPGEAAAPPEEIPVLGEAEKPAPPSRQGSQNSKDSKQRGGSKASRVVPHVEERAPSHASNAWQDQAPPQPPKQEEELPKKDDGETADPAPEPDASGKPEPGGLLGGLEEALASNEEQRKKEQEEEEARAAAEAKSAADALAAAEAAAAAEAEAAAKARAEAEAAEAEAAAAEAALKEREAKALLERQEREEREERERLERLEREREEKEREAARLEQEEREKRQREEEQRLLEEQERERELERQRAEQEKERQEQEERAREEREAQERRENEERERQEKERQEQEEKERQAKEEEEKKRALQTPSPAPPEEPEMAWLPPTAPMVVVQSSTEGASPEAGSPPTAAPSPPSPSDSQVADSLGQFLNAPASPSAGGRSLLSPPGANGQTGGNEEEEGTIAPTLSIDTSGSRTGVPLSPRNRVTPKAKAPPKDVVFLSAPLAAALRLGAFSSGSGAAGPKMGPESSSDAQVSTSINANRMLSSGPESPMAASSSANGPQAGRKAPPMSAQGREMDSSLNRLMNSNFHLDPVGTGGSTANSRNNSKLGPPPAATRVNSLPLQQPKGKAAGSALSPASTTAAAAATLAQGSTRLGSAGQSAIARSAGQASLTPSPAGSRQPSKNSTMEANPSTNSKKPGGPAQPMLFF